MGKHKFVPKKGREDVPQYGRGDIVVRAREIPDYCNEEFFTSLAYWNITKIYGMPNGNGWANEPVEVLEAFLAFEAEQSRLDKEELEKQKSKSKK